MKAVAQAENLRVGERTWEVLREEGAVVEEAVSDDEEGEGDEKGLGEKGPH